MELSISNIAWQSEDDTAVYKLMKEYGYSGLEIAPTRIFTANPYEKVEEAKLWSEQLKRENGLVVSSMQSIWFGRQEKIFGIEEERKVLFEYTKKALEFAEVIGCKNLVFGCPRNRNLPEGADVSIAIAFFRELGDYAFLHNTVIGIEANPPIYNTNYINDTALALELIEAVDSKGFLLNLDVGTMIQNDESVEELRGRVKYINHVHISEPGLKPIEERMLHNQLRDLLLEEDYQRFVSIEMGKTDDIQIIEKVLRYVGGVING